MVRSLTALFLILSFAVPSAFAGCCEALEIGFASIAIDDQENQSDEHGTTNLAAHHCFCHQHFSDRLVPTAGPLSLGLLSVAFPERTTGLAPSFDPGPLLKPPSHA